MLASSLFGRYKWKKPDFSCGGNHWSEIQHFSASIERARWMSCLHGDTIFILDYFRVSSEYRAIWPKL